MKLFLLILTCFLGILIDGTFSPYPHIYFSLSDLEYIGNIGILEVISISVSEYRQKANIGTSSDSVIIHVWAKETRQGMHYILKE